MLISCKSTEDSYPPVATADCMLAGNKVAHGQEKLGSLRSHPVLLEMRKELKGMIGALLIPLRLLAMLALGGCAGCWLWVDICNFLCRGLHLLCLAPSCLASLSYLPWMSQAEFALVCHTWLPGGLLANPNVKPGRNCYRLTHAAGHTTRTCAPLPVPWRPSAPPEQHGAQPCLLAWAPWGLGAALRQGLLAEQPWALAAA